MRSGRAWRRRPAIDSRRLRALGAVLCTFAWPTPSPAQAVCGDAATPTISAATERQGCAEVEPGVRRCRQPADDRGPGYEVREQIDSATQRKLYAVDEATYLGWLTYHAFCYICHADSGSGGEVSSPYGQGPQRVCAANLIHWFTAYNKVGDFRQAVARGKPANGMPPWDGNAVVTARVGDVFSYLRARASGHLDKPDDTPLRVLPKHKP